MKCRIVVNTELQHGCQSRASAIHLPFNVMETHIKELFEDSQRKFIWPETTAGYGAQQCILKEVQRVENGSLFVPRKADFTK
jgi:hypothetical protein